MESGLRITPIGSYAAYALVDFGPPNFATAPRVLRVLETAEAQQLLHDLLDCIDPDLQQREARDAASQPARPPVAAPITDDPPF